MTFLFTDIEGSTRLWEQHPDVAPTVIEQHDRLVEKAVEGRGGAVFHRAGDGMIARFDDPAAALNAAIAAQRLLADSEWVGIEPIRVRMGVHTGTVVVRPEGPYGWALNYGARLTDLGHGGQIVMSHPALEGLDVDTMNGIEVRDLGAQHLRDIAEPSPVFQVAVAGMASEFPPPRSSGTSRPSLPDPRTPIIGRLGDVEAVLCTLQTERCATVTGVSGVGKTRVAVAVAAKFASEHHDATVLWCDLAGVSSEAVVASIMTAHAVSRRPGLTAVESLVAWLAEHRALVVLDRCDECLRGVTELVEAALEAADTIATLCTSQRVLGITGEVVHRLSPLALDAAVDLFVERARAIGVVHVDRAAATEICRRLDGMPFAIEIVAANTSTFTLGELLDSLESTGLAIVGRQHELARSVEHAVSFGVASLDPESRDRLVAATVFCGQFDRDMFAAVCAPAARASSVASTLVALVDASLVQPEPSGERATFRLLDPVRSVVAANADEALVEAARSRLRAHAVAISAQIADGLRGPEEFRWLRTFEREFDSLRGVFDHAIDTGDIDTAVQLASDQWEWAFFRYNSEYFEWGRRAIDRFGGSDDGRLAQVHGVVALGHWLRDEIGPTFDHGRTALRLERECGGPFSLPARLAMINATVFAGATAPPAEVFAEASDYQLKRPEGYYRMNVEASNAIMATWFGQHDIAERRAVKSLRIARSSRNPTSIAYGLWVLALAIEQDDPERAEHLLADSLAQARDIENRWIMSLAQTGLASLRRRTTGYVAAAPLIAGLLEQLTRAGHWAQFWNVARLAALVVGDAGDEELAFQIAAAVDAAEITFPALPVDEQALSALRVSIVEHRGEAWANRTARIASTWDILTTASAARRAVDEVLASL